VSGRTRLPEAVRARAGGSAAARLRGQSRLRAEQDAGRAGCGQSRSLSAACRVLCVRAPCTRVARPHRRAHEAARACGFAHWRVPACGTSGRARRGTGQPWRGACRLAWGHWAQGRPGMAGSACPCWWQGCDAAAGARFCALLVLPSTSLSQGRGLLG